MPNLREFRSGKPDFYPDQSVYAEYACAEFGLAFEDIDGGTGLVFSVASAAKTIHFGAGRCSWYPQNNATASTLASDKYFTNGILERAGVATLGGEYFFLHDRHRANRPAGHEREDGIRYFQQLGATAFVEISLARYTQEVSQYYDSILIQPLVFGLEYRIFLLDDEVVHSARKYPPFLSGDGFSSLGDLLTAHNDALRSRGLSPVATDSDASLETVLPKGERWTIPGRMNLAAGGTMVLESPHREAAITQARKAARALGLRVAAVDLFTDIEGEPDAIRVVEVNSNPSIRLLEQSSRDDLILKIWRHTFSAMGLL
jgi:D-alanine-D-alanine ligase-like ATP-grasp enzyme